MYPGTLESPPAAELRRSIDLAISEIFGLNHEEATELLLIRHAQPSQDGGDPPLTEIGMAQAHALAEHLEHKWLARIYTAPSFVAGKPQASSPTSAAAR